MFTQGLFRKILTRKVRASQLVKMSTEELASKELAKWRKMENKHVSSFPCVVLQAASRLANELLCKSKENCIDYTIVQNLIQSSHTEIKHTCESRVQDEQNIMD